MASDREDPRRRDREDAVRAMLVDRAGRSRRFAWAEATMYASDRRRGAIATAIVLVVVVALSAFAIRVAGGLHGAPTGADAPVGARTGVPVPTPPPGVELGRFSSADGPDQTHVIRPNGLALATSFACEGGAEKERYLIHVPHAFDEGGACVGSGSGGGASNKGTAGSVTLSISSAKSMRWTLIVSGIPETYVTPQPVETPRDMSGATVPFCTDAVLKASFERVQMPDGVTAVSGGQLRFTNTGDSACALAGYPMVRFVDGGAVLGHHTIDHIDERSSTEKGLRPVLLQPGGAAWSQIDWYLPVYYEEGDAGPCVRRTVKSVQIDLGNRLAGAAQAGSMLVPIGTATACLNGPYGVDGKYGQLSSTVFVDYSLKKAD